MTPPPLPPHGHIAVSSERPAGPDPGARLALLAALLALLLAVAGAVLAWRNYRADRAREIDQAAALARAAAADTQRFLSDRFGTLVAIADSPTLRAADTGALHEYFVRLLAGESSLIEVLWIDPRGTVLAHALPDTPGAPPVSLADRDYFQAVMATEQPFVSAALVGRFSNRPVVVMAAPTRGADGAVTGVIAAGITLQQLEETLTEFRDPRQNRLKIVDRAGQLIVDDDPTSDIVDVSGSALLGRARDQGRGVIAEASGLRGEPDRLVAYASVPAGDWLVFVDRSAADAFGPARRRLAITLGALAIMVLAGVGGMAGAGRELDRLARSQRRALHDAVAENVERRRAEEALRTSEQRFRSLVQNATDITVVLSQDGTLQYVSPSVERVLGYQPEEWLGADVFAPMHPDDRQRLRAAFANVVTRPGIHAQIEFRLKAADGSWRYLEAVANNLLHDPAVRGVVQNVRDITERKRAEDGLRLLADAGAMLASSLDHQTTLARVARLAVPTLADWCTVHIVEEDGDIRRTALAHVDPAQEELLLDLRRRYPIDPNGPHPVARVLRGGEPLFFPHVTEEVLASFAQDEEQLASLRALIASYMVVPLTARGRTFGALALVCAGSGRIYGRADLVLAEALARRAALAIDNARLYHEAQSALTARDRFFSSVSHDLRTPLTSIKAYAQMLQRRVQRGDAIERSIDTLEALTAIDEATGKMTALIHELLDLSRLQTDRPLELELEPTDLVALVTQEAAALKRTTDRHTIQVSTDVAELTGMWDGVRLGRVVANLLSNAVKYSPAGGSVWVTLARADEVRSQWAVLCVRDDGIGIPAADLPHVFERFHRGSNVGKILGTGIGLAGSRQIVEQHGGSISVQSREGAGVTVTVRLPLTGE